MKTVVAATAGRMRGALTLSRCATEACFPSPRGMWGRHAHTYQIGHRRSVHVSRGPTQPSASRGTNGFWWR